jgi:hypothetical protein
MRVPEIFQHFCFRTKTSVTDRWRTIAAFEGHPSRSVARHFSIQAPAHGWNGWSGSCHDSDEFVGLGIQVIVCAQGLADEPAECPVALPPELAGVVGRLTEGLHDVWISAIVQSIILTIQGMAGSNLKRLIPRRDPIPLVRRVPPTATSLLRFNPQSKRRIPVTSKSLG